MLAHLRACLWLLALTVLLCSVVYPLALWGVGQAAFHEHANGSLILDGEGKPIASRLIAHEVKGAQYFQPRPSATGGSPYNAAASGASNYGASNYLLRDRVARSLAPIVKYGKGPKQGQPVADDVVAWFRTRRPGLVADWATAHASLAQNWVKSDDAAKDFVKTWFAQHPAELAAWHKENPGKNNPEPEDLAVAFFTGFSGQYPATWLAITDKRVVFVKNDDNDSADIASVFFDMWRDAHPDVALEDVPADLVTTSGSGLDPHITLEGALFQLPSVADQWAELTGDDATRLRGEIKAMLEKQARPPMFGLAGVPLVNVVEMNLEMHRKYGGKVRTPAAK
jgi:potassium-transporting ATPase KdpC subunit